MTWQHIHRYLSKLREGKSRNGKSPVHVTNGPESPTRAALAGLVAKAAADSGHEVNMFFAGDATLLMKDEIVESLQGIGIGAPSDTLPALVELTFEANGSSPTDKVAKERAVVSRHGSTRRLHLRATQVR